MIPIDPQRLESLTWEPGKLARLWLLQPRFELDERLQPRPVGLSPSATRLLATSVAEEARFPEHPEAPTLFVLPELSVSLDELEQVRDIIEGAGRNTLFIFGLSPLDEDQVHQAEPDVPAGFWQGPSSGRRTNCAAVAVGQSRRLYLQPKIVPSKWELDWIWPGAIVRYFQANYFRFLVFICSEMLDRPEDQTTAAQVMEVIQKHYGALELAIWIQYNQRPRSHGFNASVVEFQKLHTTLLTLNSSMPGPKRLNNYGVSGAIVPQEVLPSTTDLLVRDFHYVEPIDDDMTSSRIVLLRYDADAYLVSSVLAVSLVGKEGPARSALFQQAIPYVWREDQLIASAAHHHLHELTLLAATMATNGLPGGNAVIASLREAFVALSTRAFVQCLDVASMPRQESGAFPHTAGEKHVLAGKEGDARCMCWRHRECLDLIGEDEGAAQPLAELIRALAAIRMRGIDVDPAFDEDRRTNARLRLGSTVHSIGIVHAGDYHGATILTALQGVRKTRLVGAPYVILGPAAVPAREPLHSRSASAANPRWNVKAGAAGPPAIRPMFDQEFWYAYDHGDLADRLRDLVS